MRPRELTRFDGQVYDVLVVGGGIYGLACAYEAASRGLRVALVEASDFGSGAASIIRKPGMAVCGRFPPDVWVARGNRFASGARWRESLHGFCVRFRFLSARIDRCAKNRLALRAAFKVDAWLGRGAMKGLNPNCICRFRDWCLRPPHFGCFPVFDRMVSPVARSGTTTRWSRRTG